MVWVRLDEQFVQHPKVVQVGPFGVALQVAALCYANRYLTDGFIPFGAVRTLLDFNRVGENVGDRNEYWVEVGALNVAQKLVEAGMWREVEGGFQVHDFHDYQPTKEYVEAERDRNSKAGKRSAQARAGGRRAAKQPVAEHSVERDVEQSVDDATNETATLRQPVPVPDPLVPLETEDVSSGSHGDRDDPPTLTLVSSDTTTAALEPAAPPAPPPPPAAHPATAQTLLGEHLDACPKRPPKRVVGHLSGEIKKLLGEGIDPVAVRGGLAILRDRGLDPSKLPSTTNQTLNPPAPRRGYSRASPDGGTFDYLRQLHAEAQAREGG